MSTLSIKIGAVLDGSFSSTITGSTANNLQLLKNSITEVGMNLGSVMLPTLNMIKAVSTNIAQFAERYPKITTVVMGVTTALISLKIAAIGFGYALTFIKGGALALAAIMHLL